MNIEKNQINGHYVWVDKDAEIKEGDWFHLGETSLFNGGIGRVNKNVIADNGQPGLIFRKIIAASPELNLEGVPTYVEWLFENQKIELNGGNLIQVIKDVFIKGYQTAEKELPTWDDVRKSY